MDGQAIAMPAAIVTRQDDAAARVGALFDAHHQRVIACAFLIAASPSVSLAQATPSPQAQPQVEPQPQAQAAQPRPGVRITRQTGSDDRRGPQGFSVVLVLGSMQTGAQDDVPAAARKALADMKDFLPYKSYKLLDAQWSLCCGGTPVVSRLRGPDDQEYELHLSASVSGMTDSRVMVSVRFNLTEPGTPQATGDAEAATRARIAELERHLAELRIQRQELANKYSDSHPEVRSNEADRAAVEREIELTKSRAARGTASRSFSLSGRGSSIMDASFRMEVGETVVVGTSRLKGGDKALIALLTAVPSKVGTTER